MYKVVLVEDEIFARQGLRNLMNWEELGYEVVQEADNGEEALGVIAALRPELVITDIRMPVVDGLELISMVRSAGYSETRFIIISGYGDFKYAQQAIKHGVNDFILKPIDEEELTNALVELAVQMEKEKRMKDATAANATKVLGRLLRGETRIGEGEKVAFAPDLPPGGPYYYLIAEMNGLMKPGAAAADPQELQDFRKAVCEICANSGRLDHAVYLYEHRMGVLGFPLWLGKWGSDADKIAGELAERLASGLGKRFLLPVRVYLGDRADQLSDLSHAYGTASETMAYKYAFSGLKALHYREMKQQELRYMEFEPSQYAKLLEQLEEGHQEAMRGTVDWVFETMQNHRFAPEGVQNTIARYVFAVIGLIRSMRGDENRLNSLEGMLQWQDYPVTLEQLKERFRLFIEESATLTDSLRKANSKGDIMKIKSYIEQHYNEDINLKSIAARFYMNPVYLGQLFKKTFGLYFNDFLLQIRIDKAKQLLRQTEKRVYEIAREVGFENPDYFVCKFEKVEGQTPTAYRNKLLSK